jgi:hypothetical protein
LHITWLSCPQCGRYFDFRIGEYDFYYYLGPSTYCCSGCGAIYRSGRTEWKELPLLGKLAFVFFSVVLGCVAGFMGGMCMGIAAYYATHGPAWEIPGEWVVGGPWFWVGFTSWATVVLLLQVYRVVRSIQRSAAAQPVPFRTTFFNLQVSLFGKYLSSIFVAPIVGVLVHFAKQL